MKEKIEGLELNYSEVMFLFSLLIDAMLHGQESRARNKIVNLLKERITEFEKERRAIVEKFGEKDKEGKTKTEKFIQEGIEKERFVLKDQEGFNKEFQELISTCKFIFDILPSNKIDFATVKNIVFNIKKDMNYLDGEIYASLCDKLEKL